jgi:hypothetical protein
MPGGSTQGNGTVAVAFYYFGKKELIARVPVSGHGIE